MSSTAVAEQLSTVEKEADEIVDKKEKTKFSGVDVIWVLEVW